MLAPSYFVAKVQHILQLQYNLLRFFPIYLLAKTIIVVVVFYCGYFVVLRIFCKFASAKVLQIF